MCTPRQPNGRRGAAAVAQPPPVDRADRVMVATALGQRTERGSTREVCPVCPIGTCGACRASSRSAYHSHDCRPPDSVEDASACEHTAVHSADLRRRIYDTDMRTGPNCGLARIESITAILDPDAIASNLAVMVYGPRAAGPKRSTSHIPIAVSPTPDALRQRPCGPKDARSRRYDRSCPRSRRSLSVAMRQHQHVRTPSVPRARTSCG